MENSPRQQQQVLLRSTRTVTISIHQHSAMEEWFLDTSSWHLERDFSAWRTAAGYAATPARCMDQMRNVCTSMTTREGDSVFNSALCIVLDCVESSIVRQSTPKNLSHEVDAATRWTAVARGTRILSPNIFFLNLVGLIHGHFLYMLGWDRLRVLDDGDYNALSDAAQRTGSGTGNGARCIAFIAKMFHGREG